MSYLLLIEGAQNNMVFFYSEQKIKELKEKDIGSNGHLNFLILLIIIVVIFFVNYY